MAPMRALRGDGGEGDAIEPDDHASVVAVLARMEKRPGESIAAPEGRESGTPGLFPTKGPASWEPRWGHDGDREPPGRHPFAASPAVVAGESHAPTWLLGAFARRLF